MRTKRGWVRRHRVNRMLKAARGFRGGRSKLFRSAKETVRRSWWYGRADRRRKKGDFRRLWITRISASVQMRGMNYSRFIAGLKKASVELDRKTLANLALTDGEAFDALVALAKQGG